MEAINDAGRGRPGYPHSSSTKLAERLADEAPLAIGTVLFRAHDALRHVENTLELEAADPRVAELYGQAKALRKSLAAVLVEVAFEGVQLEPVTFVQPAVLDRDCLTCLVDVERCSILSVAGDRCCSACTHG